MIELLTFLLVVITAVYAYLTFQLVRASRASVAAMETQVEASIRPYVNFDLELHSGALVEASLRNSGLTAARHVSVTIIPPLEVSVAMQSRPFQLTRAPLPLLSPGREIREYIGRREHVLSLCPALNFSVTLQYENTRGQIYREDCTIDLSGIFEMAWIARPTTAKEIEKIGETLKEIHRTLKRDTPNEA